MSCHPAGKSAPPMTVPFAMSSKQSRHSHANLNLNLNFVFSQQSKTSQWTHPRTGRSKRITGELPIGWEKYYDEQSRRFMFLNKETQQRTNVDPRLAFAVEEPTQDVTRVRQRFDSCSTALQVLHGKDLHGRIALITGANCGIGFETARSLAQHGCEIIFACRNKVSAEAAIERIAQERPAARSRCRFVALDLSSLLSVKKFVTEIKESVRCVLESKLIF